MANNIAFQPMGKTYQVTASNVAANTITISADSPVNQFLVVSHEKTNGSGIPVYVRISATNVNAATPTAAGAYGIPIAPGTTRVFSGPQVSANTSVYFSAITESGTGEIYITPGEGL